MKVDHRVSKLNFILSRALLALMLPGCLLGARAQFILSTNVGAITISGYTGSGGAVTIPGSLNGLPVIGIGDRAFQYVPALTGITIPDSVLYIGNYSFIGCSNLINATIGNGATNLSEGAFIFCANLVNVKIGSRVTGIGDTAFQCCFSLANIGIPNSVTDIGEAAFNACTNLTNIVIGNGTTILEAEAFYFCPKLRAVFFTGNAPNADSSIFGGDPSAIVYYMPGKTGWSSTYASHPTILWNAQIQSPGPFFGIRTNRFGFTITGNTSLMVVVEGTTNLALGPWAPLGTNTLVSGPSFFSDARWTNFSRRYYRLRSP